MVITSEKNRKRYCDLSCYKLYKAIKKPNV